VDGFAKATQNIVQGLSRTLSDKLQRRKPIALAGYFLAAVGKPLMGLATVWQVVFAGRLLDRLGAEVQRVEQKHGEQWPKKCAGVIANSFKSESTATVLRRHR